MKTLYDGFLKIKEREHENYTYEVMDRGDSVTVLLVKPGLSFSSDQFYLGRQYRAGSNCVLFTQVAGMIDAGENPPQAGRREAMEEAGALGKMYFMYSGFPSAGGCTEKTYQYVMFVDSLSTPTDSSEVILWNWYTGSQVIEMLDNNEFGSMQTSNAIMKYIINRPNLVNINEPI
ncbi:MAG: NUDIX domain-containing protein [Bacteroidales bacterium]